MLELAHAGAPSSVPAAGPTSQLDFIWLEVTGKCNLQCVHCYAESGPQRRLHQAMAPQDWHDVLGQAAALGCRAVQFIGGEPTMYPALPALIEQARQLDYEVVEVYTNGTAFKPRVKDAFLRYRANLAFSIYAEDAQTHDLVTRRPGSLQRTLASIRWALASGLSVRVGIIEMDENAGHAQRTKEMLRAMGVTQIGSDRVRGIGRGKKSHSTETQFNELCGGCAPGKLAVTATGEIFPCVFSRFWPLGQVRDGLQAVLQSHPLAGFQAALEAERKARLAHKLERGREMMCQPGEDLPICCRPSCAPKLNPPPPPDCMPTMVCGPEKPCTPWGPTCPPKMRPGSAADEQRAS